MPRLAEPDYSGVIKYDTFYRLANASSCSAVEGIWRSRPNSSHSNQVFANVLDQTVSESACDGCQRPRRTLTHFSVALTGSESNGVVSYAGELMFTEAARELITQSYDGLIEFIEGQIVDNSSAILGKHLYFLASKSPLPIRAWRFEPGDADQCWNCKTRVVCPGCGEWIAICQRCGVRAVAFSLDQLHSSPGDPIIVNPCNKEHVVDSSANIQFDFANGSVSPWVSRRFVQLLVQLKIGPFDAHPVPAFHGFCKSGEAIPF